MTEGSSVQPERDDVVAPSSHNAPNPTGGLPPEGGESLRPLVGDLLQDVEAMVRAQVRLAQAELRGDARSVGGGAAEIGAGAVAGFVGFTFVMQSVADLLSTRLPRWAATGLVGIGLIGAAGGLGAAGKERLTQANLTPRQTIASLKETARWLQRQAAGE